MLSAPRITPAHAGKTLHRVHADRHEPDHPRACGENQISKTFQFMVDGSPPRMRGKHSLKFWKQYDKRITPAHAGKTAASPCARFPCADHPRACGENSCLIRIHLSSPGSPPRMRGKRQERSCYAASTRITPAHAGKTTTTASSSLRPTDHPRACGENGGTKEKRACARGSPPRMRGKLHTRHHRNRAGRITPAHAGKTSSRFTARSSPADHPRACGENPTTKAVRKTVNGSPPRMRGKHSRCAVPLRQARITPAHAGKTSFRDYGIEKGADHPRACGENTASSLGDMP